jgi:hypothetical protein
MNAKRLGFAALAAIGSLVVPAAHAVTGCSAVMLAGNYAMQFSGTPSVTVAKTIAGVAVPDTIVQAVTADAANGGKTTVPAAGILRLYLDGAGLVTGSSSVSLRGSWLQGAITGSYSVDSDCSATLTLTDASGASSNYAGAVVGQGDSVFVIQTDDGAGISGFARKTRGFCQTSDVAGTFGIQYSGNTADVLRRGTHLLQPGNPYSSAGIVTLDGQGGANAVESRFANGTYALKTSTGLIVINDDCSATLTLTTADADATIVSFAAMLSADSKQFLLVQSDAGMAATGTMSAQ